MIGSACTPCVRPICGVCAKFLRARGQHFAEFHQRRFDQARSFAHQQGLRGVHHIVRGHSVVQPARRGRIADRFADVHGERDHVVLHARFDFVDARDIDFRVRANRRGRFFRHFAGFRQRFRGGQLHFQPLGVFVGVAPDAAHFFAGVAWNQLWLLTLRSVERPVTTGDNVLNCNNDTVFQTCVRPA